MNLLITGGLGHIGSYFLENINKFYNIKNIYVVDANYSNNLNILFPEIFLNYIHSKMKLYHLRQYQSEVTKKFGDYVPRMTFTLGYSP